MFEHTDHCVELNVGATANIQRGQAHKPLPGVWRARNRDSGKPGSNPLAETSAPRIGSPLMLRLG